MRQCGDCQLCCKLLPVKSLNKGANEKCKHQKVHKGCMVYKDLMMHSPECRLWNCRWLVGLSGAAGRPDRVHYVIDIMPDFVTANDGGQDMNISVVQIWVDPNYRDAHKDPALREWLDKNGYIALIRFSSYEAITLFPPSRMSSKEWFIKDSGSIMGSTHTPEEFFEAMKTAV